MLLLSKKKKKKAFMEPFIAFVFLGWEWEKSNEEK